MVSDENIPVPPSELFMLRLRYKEARLVRASSNSPILLTDPQTAWIVYRGRIDVFLVPVERGRVAGTRQHLFRVQAGRAVFGIGPLQVGQDDNTAPSKEMALMAVGDPGTQLLQLKRSALSRFVPDSTFADQVISMIDGWVGGLSASLAHQAPPQGITVLEAGGEIKLDAGQVAHPNRDILWVKHVEGSSQLMGIPALPATGQDYVPLSNRTWVQVTSASRLDIINTKTWIGQDSAWSALDSFNRLALSAIQWSAAQAEQAERGHWQRRAAADERQVAHAFARLASVLEEQAAVPLSVEGDDVDPLLTACRWVGQAIGMEIRPPPRSLDGRAGQDPLRNIARASRIRIRPVTLQGQWWREDNGPLLAYLTRSPSEGQPVALVPTSNRTPVMGRRPRAAASYELLDPVTCTRTPVTAQVAADLAPRAYVFYPPFPDRPISGLDLLRFGLRGSQRQVLTVIWISLAMGGLGLITPLMMGVLFDAVIPGFQRNQLIQLGLALLVCAIASAMFQLTRNMAVLWLEGKLDSSTQAAILDRLLRLPVPFFRRYAAGDLAMRVLGISTIRQILSGAIVSSVLLGLSSILNLALLFYYASGLAWSAMGLVLVSALVTVILGWRQMHYQRDLVAVQGQISGLILQMLSGIAKLRMAGVEGRAFARWAQAFSRQRELAFRSRTAANGLVVFNSAYPVLTGLVIFALVGFAGDGQSGALYPTLSTGVFLAFNAAFTQLLLASLSVSSSLSAILSAVPIYEDITPVLHTLPEASPAQADPGTLTGEIEVSHVSFRYREDEPPVLKDVSLRVKPGEFVALVGSSGCGKSTLLRLLLKFETPLSGAIFYDGQDLERLDVEAVRRQAGVVLQDGKLISGSVLTNIIGSSLLTMEDAWEAARLVGLAQDIEQMPMGMHTVLSEGGGNISGGQRQRLLIARAIVSKPRLVFLDEATSALDNPNQALVSASLGRLSATRVVIAHRLSTIVNADRIYVLDEGRIVQSGAYAELLKQPGLFAELSKRQLA